MTLKLGKPVNRFLNDDTGTFDPSLSLGKPNQTPPRTGQGPFGYPSGTRQPAPLGLVRDRLPELKGTVAEAFDGVRPRTFKAGDRIYRTPSVDESGNLEPATAPGAWFGTRRTVTKAGTESQSNVLKWNNPLQELRAYQFTREVTVYHGKVQGGKGYQILIPKDIFPGDVLQFVPPSTPLR